MDLQAQRLQKLASALKSMYLYAIEEAERLRMDFLAGLAVEIVNGVATWDQPTMKNLLKLSNEHQFKGGGKWKGDEGFSVSEVSLQRGRGVFPVEEQWELDWEEIGEDEGLSTQLREDPSKCPDIVFTLIHGDGPEDLLEYCKRLAREGDRR